MRAGDAAADADAEAAADTYDDAAVAAAAAVVAGNEVIHIHTHTHTHKHIHTHSHTHTTLRFELNIILRSPCQVFLSRDLFKSRNAWVALARTRWPTCSAPPPLCWPIAGRKNDIQTHTQPNIYKLTNTHAHTNIYTY